MNTQETGANGATAARSPLFASSWMALYNVLRDQLDSNRGLAGESHGADSLEVIEEPSES